MKKLTALLFTVIVFVTCFAGCGKKQNNNSTGLQLTDIVLAQNNATEYTVIVPETSDECVMYAADELVKYFYQATGATLTVSTDNGKTHDKANKYISLGDTTVKSGAGLTVTKQEVNMDGYKIVRFGNTLVIAGYESRGTMYGVYEFLSQTFNFEVYAIDEVVIDRVENALLPDFNLTDKPSFEGRFLDGIMDYNQELQAKMRMKNVSLSAKYGGDAEDEWIAGHCESFFHVLDPKIYAADFPEWYSTGSGGQLCMTNDALIEEFAKVLIELIQAKPTGLYVNISEEDMGAFCSCVNCRESNKVYRLSGTLMRFCNAIIKKVEAWREAACPERELKYVTFVYRNGTMPPPVKFDEKSGKYQPLDESVIPHEKLYVRYTPILACFSHHFYDHDCSVNDTAYAASWEGWCDITDRLMVWDYNVNYSHFYMFFNNYSVIQDNYIEYYEKGVINMMREDSTGSNMSSLGDLNVYLHSKLQWNVYADQNKIINDFMDNYYKGGAPYMKEYLALMRSYLAAVEKEWAANEKELHFGIYDYNAAYLPTAEVWSKGILEQALALFDKAYAEYDKLDDKLLAEKMKDRVRKESVCVRYLVLRNYASYYNINSPAYVAAIDEWERDIRALSMLNASEGNSTLAFIDELRKKVN